ncbi:probably inactive leucine-rich repeat receptor-like protein kinase At5g48380 [Euphorbia lathyris]|uniref:probably inactive leucine-rich repeat receptor-like protein kinase At5g48380 n=1 Tax=Euphorbia lathyris TaxID=212925 RepID=UPI003313CAAD
MEVKSRAVHALSLHFFFLSLMAVFTTTTSTETDIACLKSIKASLQDPFNYLKTSWNFQINTEGFICRFAGVECWHPDENKVLNLRLSDMGLKGNFPEGLRNCTSLTGLDLSNNRFQGPIPFDIDKILPFLTSLDLSSNNFSGEIPSTIANCSRLNVLKLDHNHLKGQIPPELGFLDRIKQFSVANNYLSGPVPNFSNNASVSADSYANNKRLCGGPLRRCRKRTTKWKWRFDNSFNGGFAIGYVVFSVSTVVLYASYCVPWVHSGKGNDMITIPAMVLLMLKKKMKKYADFDQFASLSTLEFLLEKEVSNSENFVTRMRFGDLLKATENFSRDNIIGLGETGTIYKATLPNGWYLAVKKFSNSQNSEEEFITELKILGRLRHNNIIPLIGFCKESRKRLLVYNYAHNGNLSDWLHSADGKKKDALKWPLRMKIAVGLARGLAWLHHCCDFRVAHLNVSSRSILLDMNFEAKLSNFGMATLVNPNEMNDSSRGFVMDMEFWEQCFLKEDVVNFGVVLLELITGKKGSSINLAGGETFDIIDEQLVGEGHEDEMFECIRIAYKCVQPFPEQRPTMLDVYTRISNIRDTFLH